MRRCRAPSGPPGAGMSWLLVIAVCFSVWSIGTACYLAHEYDNCETTSDCPFTHVCRDNWCRLSDEYTLCGPGQPDCPSGFECREDLFACVPVDSGEGDVVADGGNDSTPDTGDVGEDTAPDTTPDVGRDPNEESDATAETDINPNDGDRDAPDVDSEVDAVVDVAPDNDTSDVAVDLTDAETGDAVADLTDVDSADTVPDETPDIDPDEGREQPDFPDIDVTHGELALRGRVVSGGGRAQGATFELRSAVGCSGQCENTIFGDTYEVTGTLRER